MGLFTIRISIPFALSPDLICHPTCLTSDAAALGDVFISFAALSVAIWIRKSETDDSDSDSDSGVSKQNQFVKLFITRVFLTLPFFRFFFPYFICLSVSSNSLVRVRRNFPTFAVS